MEEGEEKKTSSACLEAKWTVDQITGRIHCYTLLYSYVKYQLTTLFSLITFYFFLNQLCMI